MKTTFVLIGGGWRGEFYMRLAKKLPQEFAISAIVTIDKQEQDYYTSWGFTCVSSINEAVRRGGFDFVVLCVPHRIVSKIALEVLEQDVPILSETPVGATLEELHLFAKKLPENARYQVAEQYHLRPDLLSKSRVIEKGKIGSPQVASISLTNNYHAISLMRKFLKTKGVHTTITAQRFDVTGQPGFERTGVGVKESFRQYRQTLATLAFEDGKVGLYNFEDDQHRSFIRSQCIQIKGDRGEIRDQNVRYLKDFQTPILSSFQRINKGENENMEGIGLKGILFEGEWLYKNPYGEVSLSDDEIALGTCLKKMQHYCDTGSSFYSFAEAAQDFYLTLLIEKAVETGTALQTEIQPWTNNLVEEL